MNFLFDMDGVLVNSEPVILAASMEVLARHGVNACKEDFRPFIGTGEDRFIGGVAEKHGLPYHVGLKTEVYDLYVTIVDDNIGIYPSTVKTLEKLRELGHKTALASSGDHIKVMANLKAAGISTELFDAIICGDDVEKKKPAPDIYLLAAERIGANPQDCLVVEDAINGIEAGLAASMECVGVTTSFDSETLLKAGAKKTISDLWELVSI